VSVWSFTRERAPPVSSRSGGGESPRGYLCRTAHDHGYGSPNALAQIAELWVSGTGKVTGLDQDAAIKKLSYTLRLEPEEGDRCAITTSRGEIDLNGDHSMVRRLAPMI